MAFRVDRIDPANPRQYPYQRVAVVELDEAYAPLAGPTEFHLEVWQNTMHLHLCQA